MTSSNAFDNYYENNERLIQYAPSQNAGTDFNVFDRYLVRVVFPDDSGPTTEILFIF